MNPCPRSPQPLSVELQRVISLETDRSIFVQHSKKRKSKYIEHHYETQSSSEIVNFNFTFFENTRNPHIKKPTVFFFQILNDTYGIVSELFVDGILSGGYHCVVIQQEPFLLEDRVRPVITDETLLGYDDYNAYLARNVIRLVRGWLPTQGSCNGRFGFVGVSMGGIHSIGAAAFFEDAAVTVSIMAGGPNLEIFKKSEEPLVIANREALLQQYTDPQDLYNEIESMNFNVLNIARSVDTRKIKLMITLYDDIVPTKSQWALYEALGQPEIRTFPTGHMSIGLFYFTVRSQLLKWLQQGFAQPAMLEAVCDRRH